MSLKKIRKAMDILRAELESPNPLDDVTLLSDGTTIYAAHSPSEVVDVFRGGQGVFGIAVGPVQEELAGEIHDITPADASARETGPDEAPGPRSEVATS
jgi:hypothetical protein